MTLLEPKLIGMHYAHPCAADFKRTSSRSIDGPHQIGLSTNLFVCSRDAYIPDPIYWGSWPWSGAHSVSGCPPEIPNSEWWAVIMYSFNVAKRRSTYHSWMLLIWNLSFFFRLPYTYYSPLLLPLYIVMTMCRDSIRELGNCSAPRSRPCSY